MPCSLRPSAFGCAGGGTSPSASITSASVSPSSSSSAGSSSRRTGFGATGSTVILVNRSRHWQLRHSLGTTGGSGAAPSRIFGGADFHAIDERAARRRHSTSVAPGSGASSRYVPSVAALDTAPKTTAGLSMADGRHRDSTSLGRLNANNDKHCRRESRLYDADCELAAVAETCGLLRGPAAICGVIRRSSSASTPASSPASSSASSPSSAASSEIALATTTAANSPRRDISASTRVSADDRVNHPNEKIIRRACGVERVSGRPAFYRLFEFGGLVGQGNFSNVHVVYAERSGVKYAVKEIDKTRMNGKTHFVENEIAILKRCVHRNICRLFAAFQSDDFYFLVFEYAPRGDLFETIKRMNHLSERAAAQITYQVADALDYLHARRIVHRDVKPENVLLGSGMTAKLTDFGLACTVVGPLYRVCGTPTYVAPEVLTQEGYGVEVDVWSLGVLLYVMLIGFAPFRSADRAQLFRQIVRAKVSFEMPSWSRVSPRAKQLILNLLAAKPMLRVKAREVFSDPWVRIYNDARVEREL